MSRKLSRAIAVWGGMMLAESILGTLRVLYLIPRLGESRARLIGLAAGSVVIVEIARLFIRWIGISTSAELWRTGLLWAALTLIFECILGVALMGYPWTRIAQDYYLACGLLVMLSAPAIAYRLRSY